MIEREANFGEFLYTLKVLQARTEEVIVGALDDYNMSYTEFLILSYIGRNSGTSQYEIAKAFLTTRQGINNYIRKLKEKKCILMQLANEHKREKKELSLSIQGEKIIKDIESMLKEHYGEPDREKCCMLKEIKRRVVEISKQHGFR